MTYWRRLAAGLCCWAACAIAAAADAAAPSLQEAYRSLQQQFATSPFGRPIVLASREGDNAVAGSIHAVLDVPFATTARTLARPQQWCDVLFLHPNTKYCRAQEADAESSLQLRIGKKYDQPLEDAYQLRFTYRVISNGPDLLRVEMEAASGPLGTRDYHIVLEAIPVARGKTFVHFSYAYRYGTVTRLALEGYLATIARDKVGFTAVGKSDNGETRYIGGMRGLVERNTMRYYLAIDVFLHNANGTDRRTVARRLGDWYAAAARYPRQLHDMTLDQYLESKDEEYRREHRGVAAARG